MTDMVTSIGDFPIFLSEHTEKLILIAPDLTNVFLGKSG